MTNHPNRNQSYRVVYGETRPMWEQIFPSLREAHAFAKKQLKCGDVIFSVKKVRPNEGPQSITAAILAAEESSAA